MSFIHCLVYVALLCANETRNTIEFTKDTLAVVQKSVAEGKAVLVDVRSQEEWNKGHLEGSIFLPVDSLRKNVDEKKLAKTLPKKKILYTFCVVGMRAKVAASKLQKYGYIVRPLKPGYEQLIEAGLPKTKEEAPSEESATTNEDTRQRDAG
jgi:rhodanese-related sulfurtransferase